MFTLKFITSRILNVTPMNQVIFVDIMQYTLLLVRLLKLQQKSSV